MKTKEEQNLKDKNNNKIKRQVSIITVFLLLFLVATVLTILTKNVKNTNSLESDSVTITYMNGDWESKSLQAPKKEELTSIIKEEFIMVHCTSNHKNEDSLYGILDSTEDITIGEVYYSDENYLNLCDIIVNGKEYAKKYSIDMRCEHYLRNISKTITLYYDEENREWKVLDNIKLPITFNVDCNYSNGEKNFGGYRIINEYYLRDKNGDLKILARAIPVKKRENVGKIVGISSDENKVDVDLKSYMNNKYTLDGKTLEFAFFENSENIVIEEYVGKDIIFRYVLDPTENFIANLLGENAVEVHCVNEASHKDKNYPIINESVGDKKYIEIGEVYYSDEKQLNLCDIVINGELYAEKYSENVGSHYLIGEKKNIITLYYDEQNMEWKILDDTKLPIVFNVTCKVAELEGYYKVKHEYYLKDKNNNLILEGTYDLKKERISFFDYEEIKVGVSSEEESVDIEVEKKPNYNINDIEYEYEYLENSGNVIIEKDVTKEITLKYVREGENEVKLKVEKIWEDENNKYGKRPESIVLQIKNGEEIISKMEMSEENSWSSEFVVPKYDKYGKEIKYTVDEKETSKFYEKTIDGYKVINKYIGEEENKNNNEIVKDENIDTSDINIWMYVGIVIISIIVILLVNKNNKKVNNV